MTFLKQNETSCCGETKKTFSAYYDHMTLNFCDLTYSRGHVDSQPLSLFSTWRLRSRDAKQKQESDNVIG